MSVNFLPPVIEKKRGQNRKGCLTVDHEELSKLLHFLSQNYFFHQKHIFPIGFLHAKIFNGKNVENFLCNYEIGGEKAL